MRLSDTITAISSAMGNAAIGIVRLSGKDSIKIAGCIFKPSGKISLSEMESKKAYLGLIQNKEKQAIDEVMVLIMRAPNSYTSEDMVELYCHGNLVILNEVLDLLVDNGARLAERGEFTQRAFYHGKMDLSQAEAVKDLIHAVSPNAVKLALKQLKGALYYKIKEFKDKIGSITALVEASIDFSDEPLEVEKINVYKAQLKKVAIKLKQMIDGANQASIVMQGLTLAIVGEPNVGKSSLMNSLLAKDRVIVTPIAGTTRDVVEDSFIYNGLKINLADTAGIRATSNEIEAIGIEKSKVALRDADVILLVVEGHKDNDLKSDAFFNHIRDTKNVILVFNKSDLKPLALKNSSNSNFSAIEKIASVEISAKNNTGIEALKKAIYQFSVSDKNAKSDEAILSNKRQLQAGKSAYNAIDRAIIGMDEGINEELLAQDLKEALFYLGCIVGQTTADDILGKIFSEFCIGK